MFKSYSRYGQLHLILVLEMDSAKSEKLNSCIDSFAKELHCYLW